MHSLNDRCGTPSPGAPAHPDSHRADLGAQISRWDELSPRPLIRVLSIGRLEPDRFTREEFLASPNMAVSFVNDYRELWVSSKQHAVHAVVIQNSLCSFELAEAARLVRARWPEARILIVRSGEMLLDRSLYDMHLHPPVKGRALIEHIFELVDPFDEGGHGSGNR